MYKLSDRVPITYEDAMKGIHEGLYQKVSLPKKMKPKQLKEIVTKAKIELAKRKTKTPKMDYVLSDRVPITYEDAAREVMKGNYALTTVIPKEQLYKLIELIKFLWSSNIGYFILILKDFEATSV